MSNWIKRLGILSAFAFPVAVIAYRQDLMGFGTGLKLIQAGALLGAVIFVVGTIYFFVNKKKNPNAARSAVIGAAIALVPVVPLALQAQKASSLPFIHNISTDTVNAPTFHELLNHRLPTDNPHHYDAEKLAPLQKEAYPNVKTLRSSLTLSQALSKSEEIAKSLGWEIVNVDPAKGIVEATETTALWGFKDDVVVRITQDGQDTLIDLKSVSRFGGSDLGVNAARIETFLEAFAGE